MRHFFPKLFVLALFWSVLIFSCKSNDPAPLGAQSKASLLAGAAGKTKTWKIISISQQTTSGGTQNYNLDGCFTDNLFTFSNNAAQDYSATEGASKCGTSSPDQIEKGTWSFTLDGVMLNVGVDEVNSLNGLFSPDAIIIVEDTVNNQIFPLTLTYPYPAFVSKLTADQMVLELNNNIVGNNTKYTLTFLAQ